MTEEGPRVDGGGKGVEKLKGKSHKETQHKKEGDRIKGKDVSVDKRKRPVSDTGSVVKNYQCGSGVGEPVATGDSVKKRVYRKYPHNRQRSRCRECGGTGIFEHNQRRTVGTDTWEPSARPAEGRSFVNTTVEETRPDNAHGKYRDYPSLRR